MGANKTPGNDALSKEFYSREQHGMSPVGNLINMDKIGKIASVGFDSTSGEYLNELGH